MLTKRFKHASPSAKAFLIFAFAIALALIIPIKKSHIDVNSILAATAIFYSILLGFYIAAAMSNLSQLKTLIATETGSLIAVFHIVAMALPHRVNSTRETIDNYLIKRFDFEVDNYTEPTTNEFYAIFDVLKGAETKSEGEGAAINYIAETMLYTGQARRGLTIVGAKVVNGASWLLLTTLSGIIVFTLFLMRDGTFESAIVSAFLAASAVLSLFILADVDGNRFGEEQFAIDTYQDVFSAMGLPHYYPKHYLEAGRYKPAIKTYRTGDSGSVHTVNQAHISNNLTS
jgi:hypothetical protein